ncbi:leucine-rich repeat-containing protein 74A-like [Lethenteron reissneri]|uniref:leucine-rich repeat-containing protein 74A-like n=1 Tax=Lethenteron reissneri TaxID=7753 RepID=UPI002AB7C093|nr:leucine-rich repeat-containing protein 74A-like [Lethenteron reissneri]
MDQGLSGEADETESDQVREQTRDQPPDHVREKESTEAGPAAVHEYRRACGRLGVVPCSPLLRALTSSTVSMNHRGLGPQEARALSCALVADQQVRHLQLRDNFLTGEAARHLADMLTKNCCIEVLDLADNRLEAAGAEAMAQMLGDTTSLRVINLSGNHFKDNDAKCLADAMASNYSVKELDLSHNEFSEMGGEHLGQLLAHNETLEELELSWNHLRLKGAVALCAGLRVNYALTHLHLSVNGLGNEGALAMAEALKFNGALLHLDLRNNRIGNTGMEALARGLLANDSLRVLQLCFNIFTVEGALVLIKAVKVNEHSALERFDMSTVRVNQAFLHTVSAIRRTQGLTVLHSGVGGPLARKPKPRTDPMKLIQDYLVEHKLRLWDFFRSADKEGTMKISSDDFRRAVQHLSIPLDKHHLDELMLKLERDKDGRIDYRRDLRVPPNARRDARVPLQMPRRRINHQCFLEAELQSLYTFIHCCDTHAPPSTTGPFRSLVDTRKKLVHDTRTLIRKEERQQRSERQRTDRVLHTFRTTVGVLTPVGSAFMGSDSSQSQHGHADTVSRRSTPDGKFSRATSGVSAKSVSAGRSAGATSSAIVNRKGGPVAVTVKEKVPSTEKPSHRAMLPAQPAAAALKTTEDGDCSIPRSAHLTVGSQKTSAGTDTGTAGTATPRSSRKSGSTSARSVTFSDATAVSEQPGSRCSPSWPLLGPTPPASAKAAASQLPRAPTRSQTPGRNPP